MRTANSALQRFKSFIDITSEFKIWKSDHRNYWTINTNVKKLWQHKLLNNDSHNWLQTNFHIGNQLIFFSIMKTVLLSNGYISRDKLMKWWVASQAMSSEEYDYKRRCTWIIGSKLTAQTVSARDVWQNILEDNISLG